jgi:hypothetical protein
MVYGPTQLLLEMHRKICYSPKDWSLEDVLARRNDNAICMGKWEIKTYVDAIIVVIIALSKTKGRTFSD